jgi:Methyltransferase domain
VSAEARLAPAAAAEAPAAPVPSPPVALRLAGGLLVPGGRELSARLVEALGVGPADRVVHLGAGLGWGSPPILATRPGEYVAVEADPLAQARLRQRVAGPGRTGRQRPPEATGLPEGSASVVVVDGLLSALPDPAKAAVLAEAARLLPSGGRLGLHELAVAPSEDGEPPADVGGGPWLHPLTPDGWREVVRAARFVPTGSRTAPLETPLVRDLMRDAGPRTALSLVRELALDQGLRRHAERVRAALQVEARRLRGVVVVAERPLIHGLRRPRY